MVMDSGLDAYASPRNDEGGDAYMNTLYSIFLFGTSGPKCVWDGSGAGLLAFV